MKGGCYECGRDFLIEEQVYITGPYVKDSEISGYGGGTTLDKVIASARQLMGVVDIVADMIHVVHLYLG